MALVYKRSTKNAARRYERSSGMEPNRRGVRSNPGVTALTVVNSGRPPRQNPLQWISGRRRPVHLSPMYRSLRGAKGWPGKQKPDVAGKAKLYAVDEYGNILTGPVPKKLLQNTRRSEMAYNIGALRRAMRANYRGSGGAHLGAARSVDTGRRPSARRSRAHGRTSAPDLSGFGFMAGGEAPDLSGFGGLRMTETPSAGGMTLSSTGGKKRGKGKGKPRKGHKTSKPKSRKSSKPKASKKRSSKKRSSKKAAAKSSKKRSSKKRSSKKAAARKTTRGGKRRRRTVRGSKRRSSRSRYFHGKRLRMTGREYIDKYLTRGVLPAIARVGRMPLSRSGRPAIWTYPIPKGIGRSSKSRTVRGSSRRGYAIGATYRGRRRKRMSAMAANRRRSRRNSRRRHSRRNSRRHSRRNGRRRVRRNVAYALANNKRRRTRRNSRRRHTKRNVAYATANRRRRTRRNSRRRGSRRRVSRNQRYVVMNRRRHTRRNSKRRHSKRGHRRSSSGWLYSNRRRHTRRNSRRRMTRNMLAVSKVKYRGTGSKRMGSARGRLYQLVEYGPKSGRFKKRGYPVLVPPSVSMHSYVRKFRFGGAAKDSHARAKASGYSEKRYSRWRTPPAWFTRRQSKKVTSNKRRRGTHRNRRTSMRRNQKYVVMNRRRHTKRNKRRGMRRNFALLGGADLMRDVVTPVIGGTVGFVAARLLSNGLANVAQVRGMLDSGADAANASNTKIAANLLGIAATLGLSTQVPMIRQNRGALVTGMGLALTDRLIQKFATGTPAAAYLGEYVDQPMSGMGIAYAAAGVGEYVDQPMSGLGRGIEYATAGLGYAEGPDPANQDEVDGLMNVMEAAAGMGIAEAAAGMGATMGSGEADAQLAAMYAKRQPPFVSTTMPVDGALPVTKTLPLDKPVQESLVTPEGKGFAGGLFARHLFAGMMGA